MTISDLTLKQLRSYSVIKECLQMIEHNFKRGVLVFNLKVQKTLPMKRVLETSNNLSSQEKYLPLQFGIILGKGFQYLHHYYGLKYPAVIYTWKICHSEVGSWGVVAGWLLLDSRPERKGAACPRSLFPSTGSRPSPSLTTMMRSALLCLAMAQTQKKQTTVDWNLQTHKSK